MKVTQDNTPKIPVVIAQSACTKHGATIGEACFNIRGKVEPLMGICNARALKVGYNGRISEKASTHVRYQHKS